VALLVQEHEVLVGPLHDPGLVEGGHLDTEQLSLAAVVVAQQRLHLVLVAQDLDLEKGLDWSDMEFLTYNLKVVDLGPVL